MADVERVMCGNMFQRNAEKCGRVQAQIFPRRAQSTSCNVSGPAMNRLPSRSACDSHIVPYHHMIRLGRVRRTAGELTFAASALIKGAPLSAHCAKLQIPSSRHRVVTSTSRGPFTAHRLCGSSPYPQTMSANKVSNDKSSPRQNRQDLLQPDFTPHPPVQRLGEDLLHGPGLQDHIVIVLGVGPGLGIEIARVFAARGYITAILSRSKQRLETWANELHDTALAFRRANNIPIGKEGERLSGAFACDALDNAAITKAVQDVCDFWPSKKLGTACYNASVRKRGPFLEQRLEQVQEGVQGSILAGFTFAQATLRRMEGHGEGGSLIVTGATSSTRGREGFAGFAASSEFFITDAKYEYIPQASY